MNKKSLKKFLVITLLLIEVVTLSLSYKSYDNKHINNLSEKHETEKKLFSMFIETDSGYVEYTESDKFPEGYVMNSEKTKCADDRGIEVENVILYRNNKITVTSNRTMYCYIYFDRERTLDNVCTSGTPLGKCLLDNNDYLENLNSNIEGGLYRYQGEQSVVNDNYICFGTGSKETCLNNPDKYMYRIIGIDESKQVKMIKKEALDEKMQWWTDTKTNIKWPDSIIYNNINGSSYLNNPTYVPNGWGDKIATINWKYGDNGYSNISALEVYSRETAWTNSVPAKIGLMYSYDYVYGLLGGNNCSSSGAYGTCKTSWIHLSNNDTSSSEWTMVRYGIYQSNYEARALETTGINSVWYMTNYYAIRPVFYLNSTEAYVSGSGTIDNPIMLQSPGILITYEGTEASNNWYTSMKITATGESSNTSTIKSCVTTENICTPTTSKTGNTVTVELESNTEAQKACFQTINSDGTTSDIVCSYDYLIDDSDTSVVYSIASSTTGNTGWYKSLSLKITGSNNYSGVSSIKYCLTTSSTCTPTTEVQGNITTIVFDTNASAQRVCATATDNKGVTTDVTCSSAYQVDKDVPTITTQPVSSAVAIGNTAKFSVVATDDTTLTYLWQVKTSSTGSWGSTTLTGYKTATISVPSTAARNGYQYRCVVTDAAGNQTISTAATITTYTALSITTQPSDVTTAIGDGRANISVVATGEELTYQWQYQSPTGTTWGNTTLLGYATATLQVPINESWRSGYKYRVKITDKYGNTVTSNAATLTLYQKLEITTQPTSATMALNDTAKFSVVATGEELTYQWQYQSPSGTTWTNTTVTGNKTATITMSATNGRAGYKYRCVITDKYGNTVNSDVASLTVVALEQTQTSIKATVTGTNIATYYYKIGSGSYVSSTSNSYTFSSLSPDTSYTINIYVKDSSGNTSSTMTKTIKTISDKLGEYLIETMPEGLSTLEGDMYRYQGTTANNYVCFGTETKSSCTGSSSYRYMYRIIGITSDGMVKLIKNEAMSSRLQWHSSETSDVTWPNSSLYNKINGSTFLNSTTYVPSGWDDHIVDYDWKYGDIRVSNYIASSLYTRESASWTSSVTAKVGLMYFSDYYYASSSTANCYSTACESWLWIGNCDSELSGDDLYEWTMSRYGINSDNDYSAYNINKDATTASPALVTDYASIRPVFYLSADVINTSGTGTSSDPYMLEK